MKNEIALAHHWAVSMRGGEKVLEQFAYLFPGAPIYTLVANLPQLSAEFHRHPIHTSPVMRFPGGLKYYKKLLPLFPRAYRSIHVKGKPRLLLSSDASLVKGLSYEADVPHVCYCHSPPRYLWGLQEAYLQHTAGLNGLGRAVLQSITPYLQRFDLEAARRVDHFIANSSFVQTRIREHYGRESEVIHPPVAVDDFHCGQPAEDFYLVISELVPYKRIDLAVETFNRLGKRLVIIGSGSEHEALQAHAKANITFLGRQPFPVLKQHIEHCRALIFPGVEDFGITPLEAQAAGRPVLAFGEGGALETVIDGVTGAFFHEQSADALTEALLAFEKNAGEFSPEACRQNAERFSPAHFQAKMKQFLAAKLPEIFQNYVWPNEITPVPDRAPALERLAA